MGHSLFNSIFAVVLITLLVYLGSWTYNYFRIELTRKREETNSNIREKLTAIRRRTIGASKNYWYLINEASESENIEDTYHYFNDKDECILDLITEMYDLGLVRTDELKKIASATPTTNKKNGKGKSKGTANSNKKQSDSKQTNANIEKKIEKCWNTYVDSIEKEINITCNEEIKSGIYEGLRDYGKKDISILINSPK